MLKEMAQNVRDANNIIKLQIQKIDGIDPEFFSKKDVYVSFFNGQEPDLEEEIDSDDSNYVKVSAMEKFLSRPITHYIVISLDNKKYKLWCGIEILSCLISSYIYAYCSVF